MREFLESLSLETRQRRFLQSMPMIPSPVLRHFTFFNPRERLVVVAMGIVAGREEIVGVADVAGLGGQTAELGVVVDDDQQGRGVGRLLTEVIASLAIQQGAPELKSELGGAKRADARPPQSARADADRGRRRRDGGPHHPGRRAAPRGLNARSGPG